MILIKYIVVEMCIKLKIVFVVVYIILKCL